MRNTVKFGMVSADKIMLSGTGIRLLDVHSTIEEGLSQAELALYTKAINKVSQGEKLNRKDLKVLDRIDQLTMDVHGICLKDSKVTKARMKAAKRYGMQFIDRDGLVEHMNMALGIADQGDEGELVFVPIHTLAKQMGTSVLMIEKHYSHLQVIQAIEQLRGTNTRKLIETDTKAADNYPSKKLAEREIRMCH